ncbi:M14 family metallopeptidase [Maribacter aurantiacus]|uniref:Peptidase M14 n=1 Tax=Maribacter aurantiacus TaxID=1882343 RepID=A0A5R8M5R8_9FLAO|nr:M14 metallopeptidase family protein [Maribacter aurantiacus]TLF44906.1 peptidase M14 [Maribacter aurantiacus]
MPDKDDYLNFKVTSVQGRYVTNQHIEAFLNGLGNSFNLKVLGRSVKDRPIYGVRVGQGPKRILMWSQMHGNESTTTKAVLDLLNLLKQSPSLVGDFLGKVTLQIIPILNPDGAKAYTRSNSNEIDLNRDAQHRSQPESKVLRRVFEAFKPDYCFNLHDQRTIFNVGSIKSPATVSFLAPSFDEARNNSDSRGIAMKIIVAMNEELQKSVPGQVGRFDDSFNPNCVGDAFQMEGIPTILFEAGHFPGDYQRERTRDLIFQALYKAIYTIANDKMDSYPLENYFKIPENNKLFVDILVENAHILDESLQEGECISLLYKEVLEDNNVKFVPTITEKGHKPNIYFGHITKDCLIKQDLNWLNTKKITDLIKQ